MVPLFAAGTPGGVELVVVLLIAAFGIVPALAVVVGVSFLGKSRGRAEVYEQNRDRDRTN